MTRRFFIRPANRFATVTVASVEPLAMLSGRAHAVSIPAASAEPGRPRETTNAGAYVHFGGARFYTSGRAVTHDLPRFTRTGEVGSAGVYLEIGGSDTTIFVEAVPGGPLAPYTRR